MVAIAVYEYRHCCVCCLSVLMVSPSLNANETYWASEGCQAGCCPVHISGGRIMTSDTTNTVVCTWIVTELPEMLYVTAYKSDQCSSWLVQTTGKAMGPCLEMTSNTSLQKEKVPAAFKEVTVNPLLISWYGYWPQLLVWTLPYFQGLLSNCGKTFWAASNVLRSPCLQFLSALGMSIL